MPYLLLYEGLGTFVEPLAYGFVVALACLGLLSVKALLLFLCFSFGLTAVVRILSLLADVLYFRVYPRRNLMTLVGLALVETPIYHVALLPCRMLAFLEFVRGRRTHETLLRTAIASGTPSSELR